jgi:hypothetical protein
MTLLGLILSLLFVPSIQEKNRVIGSNQPWKLCTVISMFNPLRIFRQFVYPNVFLAVSFSIYNDPLRSLSTNNE